MNFCGSSICHKLNQIRAWRIRKISSETPESELDKMHNAMRKNGYPENVIDQYIGNEPKIHEFHTIPKKELLITSPSLMIVLMCFPSSEIQRLFGLPLMLRNKGCFIHLTRSSINESKVVYYCQWIRSAFISPHALVEQVIPVGSRSTGSINTSLHG